MKSPDERFQDKKDHILGVVCVKYGFCLPYSATKEIDAMDEWEADWLVREVWRLEGLNPEDRMGLFRDMKRTFTDRYGKYLSRSDFHDGVEFVPKMGPLRGRKGK